MEAPYLANLTIEQAAEMLAKEAAAGQQLRSFTKQAEGDYLSKVLPKDWWQTVSSQPWGKDFGSALSTTVNKTPNWAKGLLAGGALGAGAGALSSLARDKEERNMGQSALTGAMAGGLMGGGLGLAFPEIKNPFAGPKTPENTLTTPEEVAAALEQAKRSPTDLGKILSQNQRHAQDNPDLVNKAEQYAKDLSSPLISPVSGAGGAAIGATAGAGGEATARGIARLQAGRITDLSTEDVRNTLDDLAAVYEDGRTQLPAQLNQLDAETASELFKKQLKARALPPELGSDPRSMSPAQVAHRAGLAARRNRLSQIPKVLPTRGAAIGGGVGAGLGLFAPWLWERATGYNPSAELEKTLAEWGNQ